VRTIRGLMGLGLALSSFVIIRVSGSPPEFIYPIDNITVAAGREAQFTCVVNNLEGHKVAWLRSDSKAILAIHNHMVTNNQRMTVSHNGHNTWKLHIKDVQRNDSGHYMCQINTEPMVSQIGMLEVVEAPDILYNETSNDTITMEGASATLRCEARGYPEPTLTWQREDKQPIVLRDSSGGSMRVKEGIEGSILSLTKLTRADGGAYLCIAQNGVPSPVSKRIMVHVHFHPSLSAKQQLVSTAAGTQANMECKVEASPRSVNYWVKLGQGPNAQEMSINPGGRTKIVDIDENSYTQRMILTIENVKSRDFGTYACVTRNSLGEVRRTVQLQEMKIELSPTIATIPPETTTVKRRRNGRRNKKKDRQNNKRVESSDLEGWDGGIDAFVPFEEKENFEQIENKVATFTYSIPTERVSSEYRNTWRSSGASPTYLHISSNLLIITMPLLISILCSATSLIV